MASRPTESTSPADSTPPTIVYRAITLRVDLRALAALGGALIIVGALLPWVTPLFEPFQRAFGNTTPVGGWPIAIIGVIAIVILFLPRVRTPRVSTPVAILGIITGLLALNSAINTLNLRQIVIGDQPLSPLSGVGLGVYITLAGSIIAILAGLAPRQLNDEAARAEIRLWQSSFAIFGSLFVILVLAAIGLGVWLGGGGSAGRSGTPTPQPFNAGLLATPLINAQVNPLTTSALDTPTVPTEAPPTTQVVIEVTPANQLLNPTPTNTLRPLLPAFTPTPTFTPPPTATHTPVPSPSPTLPNSPLTTPTTTATATPTTTATSTPTVTATP